MVRVCLVAGFGEFCAADGFSPIAATAPLAPMRIKCLRSNCISASLKPKARLYEVFCSGLVEAMPCAFPVCGECVPRCVANSSAFGQSGWLRERDRVLYCVHRKELAWEEPNQHRRRF